VLDTSAQIVDKRGMKNTQRKAYDALAASDPRFDSFWIDGDSFLANTTGCNVDGMFEGELWDSGDWVTETDGRAINGERVDVIGAGWVVVVVDWRLAHEEG
jgi:hypothetical protein